MSEPTPMWHEYVLDKLERGNNIYTLLSESYDAIQRTRTKVWAVKSDTDPMQWYYVIDLPGVGRICSCDGFRFTNHCKHTGRVPEK